MKPEHRAYGLDKVVRRAYQEELVRIDARKGFTLEVLINEVLNAEMQRLKEYRKAPRHHEDKQFWAEISRRFRRANSDQQTEILLDIIKRFASEVIGNFDERLYRVATNIVPWAMKLLLAKTSPQNFLTGLSNRFNLEDVLSVTGHIEEARELAKRGTLIMTPMHISNLDSIAVGLALHSSKLPPFLYGAGLNLFSNPIISFFLNNLGAYKVDRTKTSPLYKNVLKHYATLSLELGNHNLFFPGGTRNRRGDVEQYLKLGLLGCGLGAYQNNLKSGKEKPDIFVIPVTISEGLVLEASSLISDFLKSTGKSRYIIDREGLGGSFKTLRFVNNLRTLNSRIHIHLCEALDLFGNRVNSQGESLDVQGRVINRSRYLMHNGTIVTDAQRDREYTRNLGRTVLQYFQKSNFPQATHLCAFALFELLFDSRSDRSIDLYQFLRSDAGLKGMERSQFLERISLLMGELQKLEVSGKICLDTLLKNGSSEDIYNTALRLFTSYHSGRTMLEKNGRVLSLDLRLLYFYHNRLEHYGLEQTLQSDFSNLGQGQSHVSA